MVRMMTTHALNALKGWPAMHALDFEAPLAAATTLPVYSGTVMSLNSSGELVRGVGSGNTMPLFAFPNSDDPDVSMDGGDPSTDEQCWVPIGPSDKVVCLVATGSYELTSTEYTGVEGDFTPNVMLTSPLGTSDIGKLIPGTIGTHCICGVVSRGLVPNGYGGTSLAFWSWFGPPGL